MSTTNWTGIGRQILDQYLQSEQGGSGGDAGQFGVDVFTNGFEDEFPGDSEDPVAGTYQGYSLEANRASESRPWGGTFGDRPKIHELNQPPAAQVLGWRVIDFYPNRDFKSEFYRLAGTPAELRQMLQIIQATRFVTGNRINFNAWFELWEKGFSGFTADRAETNFALTGDKQWTRIKNPETRPRYREWTNSQQRADLGFRVIEYWRDRSVESDSVILSGNDLQLMEHIIQIEYEGGSGSSRKLPSYEKSNKGLPLISLYFEQDSDKVGKNTNGKPYSPLQGEISLRLVDKSENPESSLDKLTKVDIKRYAQRIKDLFGENDGYVWEKGRKIVCYNKPEHGFKRTWYMCKTHADGIALLGKLTQIIDKPLDRSHITKNEIEDEVQRFAEKQPLVILGEIVEQEQERSIGDVRFKKAEIYLPRSRKTFRLVTGLTVNYT